MPTPLSTILVYVRDQLNEPVPNFWQDSELVRYANRGIRDLWRRIKDTHQNYHFEVSTAVTLAAAADQLTNVPTNVGVVHGIEPADLSASPLLFRAAQYTGVEFQRARQASQAHEPGQPGTIWYAITGPGAPVAAPIIRTAPRLSSELTLRLTYQPVIGTELVVTDIVPVPGEADQAIIEWVLAYAIARERNSAKPDETRMALYEREVAKILVGISPREDDEPPVVTPMFGEYW